MRKFFKYLSYTLIFMVMSIVSAYGAITISMNNASNLQNSIMNPAPEPLPEQLTSIYENIANTDAMQINLSANLASSTDNYIIDLVVNMDTSEGFENVALDGSLKIAGNSRANLYDIDFSYQNGMAYFDMFNGRLAVDTTTIIEPLMSILSILDIEVPSLGMDLSTLTPDVILGMLTNFTEEKQEGSTTLVVDVPVVGKLNLVCDLDYNVKELSLPEISFNEDSSLTLSSNINYPESVVIAEKFEEDYVKVGNLLNVAETVLKTLDQDNVGFEFSVNIEDNAVEGKVYADLVNLSAMASIDLLGNELKLFAVDNIIYIEYGNLYASFSLGDFEKINQLLKNQFGIEIPLDTITNMLTSLKNGNLNEVMSGFNVKFDPTSIDLSLLENVMVKDNLTAIKVRGVGDFGVIVDDNGDLTRLAYSGNNIEAVLETINYKEFSLKTDKEDYIDLAKLIPTAENAISIVKSETLSGKVEIAIGEIKVPFVYEISKKDGEDVYGNIEGDIFGAKLEINYINNKMFITFADSELIVVDLNSLQSEINSFLAELELDVKLDSLAQLVGAVGLFINPKVPLFTGLTETENGFILTTDGGLEIIATNSTNEIQISSTANGFSFFANIIGSNSDVERVQVEESNFTPFINILNLGKAFIEAGLLETTEGILNYVKNGNFGLEVSLLYEGQEFEGTVNLDIENKSAKISIDVNGKPLNLIFVQRTLYIEHGNIYVQFNINNLSEIESFLAEYFGIEVPLGMIVEILDKMESDSPLSIFALLGLSLDLSKIDLAFFDGIVVDGNVTTIPVENVGEVKVTLADKVLSNIAFSGNGIEASVDFTEFEEFTLNTTEGNYIDVIKFLPTVENAIDIVNCETISGVIDVNIDQTALSIDYLVEKRDVNDIYAELSTNVLGADITAFYLNSKVYINVADSFKLAVNVTSLPDAISEFLTAINVELSTPSTNETITQVVGLIASVIYDEATPLLVTSLTETTNGLDIEVFNGLVLSIVNGTNKLTLNGSYDNVTVNVSIIGGNLEVIRPTIDEAEYNQFETVLDLAEKVINSGLIEIAECAYNYFKDGNIGLKINATYNETTINGSLNVNLENMSMKFSAYVDDIYVNIVLLDEIIYLEVGNIYAKFNLSDVTTVESFLQDNFGINLPISEITDKMEETQNSDTPLENLSNIGIIDLSVISLAFFDGIVVDGNVTTIPVENVGEVKITLTDKVLSNIAFSGNGIEASVDFTEFEGFTLNTTEGNYIDVIKFLPTVENAIDIVNCETISGVIDVNIDQTALSIDYLVEKRDVNDIYAELSTNVLGADITAFYLNSKVYINVADSFKLAVNVTSLPDAITEFLTAINVELDTPSTDETITQVVGLIASVIYNEATPLLVTGLTETTNGLDIEVFNGLVLSIVNGTNELTLNGSYDNVTVNVSIIGGNLEVTRPTIDEAEYNQFETVLDLAEKVINSGLVEVAEGTYNYFKNGLNLGLSFNATYKETSVTGNVYFNLEAKEIKVSVVYDGVAINVIVLDKVVYLEIGNIYLKFAVSDLDKIETLLRDHFDIDIPLSQIIEMFEDTATSDEPLANLSDIGIIDLSAIDLAFFDSITQNGNTTIIPIENVGEIGITVTDKLLTGLTFSRTDITANAQFIDFVDFDLSVTKDSYIDLIKLLPTIENAITIINSPSISGTVNISNSISIDFAVNKADTSNIYFEASTQIQGANLKVMYLGGKVYIHFAETIKLVADFETLPQTINNLLEKADVAFEISENVSADSILDSIFGLIDPASTPILITGLTEGANNSLTITLHDNTTITLDNLSREIDFSVTDDISGFIIGDERAISIPTIDDSLYIPLEDVLDLVEAFLNMAKLEDFHISGTFDIVGTIAGIDITWNVPYDLKIKVIDGEVHAMFVMGEIPVVVGLNNDVPYIVGDTNGGKNRYMTIYVKGSDVYIYRSEDVNVVFGMDARRYEKCTKITTEAFLADPMRYVQYAIGFSDTIMDAISESILKATNRENPINLNNVVKSLKVVNDTSFEIVLNAAELANNTDLDTLTLNLGIAYDGNGESYLSTLGLNVNMPLADIFVLNLTTSDTKIVNYGSPVDMTALFNYINNYTYAYDAEWEASNGAWTKASETIYTITFEENGGTEVNNISKAYGNEITLPILSPIESDDGTAKTIKTFAGWYTTSTFDEGSLFTQTTMPRGDKTLYAKWNVEVTYYRTINFVTNSNETASPITALEGSEIILPSLNLKEIETETAITIYSFEGWFVDEALTQEFTDYIMPSENITLYAKWEVADTTEAKLLEIYDNGQVIYSRYIISGREIDLSKVGKVNSSTKFYLASNYSTLYEGDFIMPEENLALHIRNQYTLTVTSEYGTIVNSTETYWQGQSISIPAQQTVVDDDYTTRQITYTFNGYKVNGSISDVPTVMPNSNTTVEASWTVTTKKYYTVSFVTQWTKPNAWMDNENKWTGNIDCKTAPGTIAPVKALEGTNFNPSGYSTTAKYSYQAMLITAEYDFKILAWNTTGVTNVSDGVTNGNYDAITSYTITDNVTFYPTWGVD